MTSNFIVVTDHIFYCNAVLLYQNIDKLDAGYHFKRWPEYHLYEESGGNFVISSLRRFERVYKIDSLIDSIRFVNGLRFIPSYYRYTKFESLEDLLSYLTVQSVVES